MAVNPNHYARGLDLDQPRERTARLVRINQAKSMLLRALDGSIVVRNHMDVRDIPQQVPCQLDDLACFVENSSFEAIRQTVSRRVEVKHRQMAEIERLGGAINGSHQVLYSIPCPLRSAVAIQMASAFGHERFGSASSRHTQELHMVDFSEGFPEEGVEQDRAVLRVMTAAVLDVENGIDLANSEAAEALGYSTRPVVRGIGRLSLVR